MLSINIPVYNVEVVGLVKQLLEQANNFEISYEVRVYDDGSDEIIKSLNRYVLQMPNVVYVELAKNIGRAAIRNKMGLESEFEYLLFIDADSALVKNDYLKVFIQHIKPKQVLCGGTAYSAQKPNDKEKTLRWIYGQKREAISAKQRNRKKGFIITSNNFLIEKEVFQQIHFRESLKKYGHEDTLLGYDLFKNNFSIFHIENPVEHTGLESSQLFLAKTKMALINLKMVSEDLLEGDKMFSRQVNFLRTYSLVRKIIPRVLLRKCFNLYQQRMENNLKGANPNLRLFDFYKLTYFSTLRAELD